MTNHSVSRAARQCRVRLATVILMAGSAISVQSALAVSFESENGTVYGSWDTTLSYGLAWRIEERDPAIIGITNGGTAYSVNSDDGNLNFGRGLIGNAVKMTTEIEFNWGNFGFFTRARGFYDFEVQGQGPDRTPLVEQALDKVGANFGLLDAFGWYKFEIGDLPAEIRIGEQVTSWGESTFIQNGINVINHFDVSALRVPGAELREALLPQDLFWFSMDINDNASIELVYQYDWDDTEPDPSGAYFSFNDFVPDGGDKVFLGFGDVRDIDPQIPYQPCDLCPTPSSAVPTDHQFQSIPRINSIEPEDANQYGAALRWFLQDFNGGTEVGFYYYKYHSRLPLISARTGTLEGLGGAAAISAGAGSIAATVGGYLAANPNDVEGAIAAGAASASSLIAPYAAVGIAAAAATGGDISATATAYAVDAMAVTSAYFTSFPEDIQMFGVSFNTQIGDTAVQGEYSFRQDVPLQVDDLEILFAGLSPVNDALAQGQLGSYSFNTISPHFNPDTPPQTTIVGFKRLDVSQFQFTATKVFPPTFGASQAVLLFEGAVNHVHDMPSKDVLRFNGPGTFVSGNPELGPVSHPGKPFEDAKHFADDTSWGYRLAGRLDYLNAIGPVNVFPFFSWQHDVSGVSPGPGGSFIEGRHALTLGVRGNYQAKWETQLTYTTFGGAGRYNLINDRDFVSVNVKYSF